MKCQIPFFLFWEKIRKISVICRLLNKLKDMSKGSETHNIEESYMPLLPGDAFQTS